ncbi:transcription initiation factor IIE subunit beta [Cylindrobasidium torrendii FP15055 ss-10]|uniref:Transcription initiation factor IIE subunit beta n=1 Tax=Cylindrobasidium torrendii FP15055 ss-10 TaxID=1314674 RepID=A0A0D7BKB6_9AGAR|nr:transcription initiation factor IIE subunit beta [Cylindrobasidium torrendii FP15055 ss-10]
MSKEPSAFKQSLKRDYTSWTAQPQKSGDADYEPEAAPAPKKKAKTKSNVVFSQPKDTGTGVHVNTQLVYAVQHLKTNQNPMRLQDLAIMTNTPLDTDEALLEKFKAHDKVAYDEKTGLYSYKHEFNFRNKASLLTEIQRRTRKGGGIAVRDLKDVWKEAPAAVEELEKEGEVLVTRTAKDGQLKMVFWNEVKPGEETGGQNVEKEFMDLWHALKVPDDVDLLRQLGADGLQVTASANPVPNKGAQPKKKGKKGGAPRQRQIKLTNTHLKGEIDLTKDFAFQFGSNKS